MLLLLVLLRRCWVAGSAVRLAELLNPTTMNALTLWLTDTGTDPVEAMNRLQSQGGIISDNCVTAEDVAADDAGNAVAWLAFSNRKQQPNP